MNPFDDAVRDLMTHLPPDTNMDGVRKRVRRHRRNRVLTALVAVSAISAASVSVAASLGGKSSGPTVAVSPSTTDSDATTTTTARTSAGDECPFSGRTDTVTVFDHGTYRPIQINRAYYCRKGNELNPPKGSHLTGTISVYYGKVVATYYRLRDVMTVRPDGVVVDTGVAGTDPVPTDQLPATLQLALATP